VFPAILCCIMAFIVMRYGDDNPKGNVRALRRQPNSMHANVDNVSVLWRIWENFSQSSSNTNTWLLAFQYGCCFGVELTMTQGAALYYAEEFGQTVEGAAAIASIFGWMNLFARGIGGFCSDLANAKAGLRGRLWCQVILLVVEGCLVMVFATTKTLGGAIVVMIMFSIFVQAAEGSTYGLVSYVDNTVRGSVAGLVGAGGNIGGACFALLMANYTYRTSFFWMGLVVVASSLWTVFVNIPGHRGLLTGHDCEAVLNHRRKAKLPSVIIINSGDCIDQNVDDGGYSIKD
jgi:MFS transporter, NNP family, nitrate/nitrite transporter